MNGSTNVSRILSVLGFVAGTFSIISLIDRTYNVGLSSIFLDLVSYYRAIVWPIVSFIPDFFQIKVDPITKDLWVVSFIGGAGYTYAFSRVDASNFDPDGYIKFAYSTWARPFFIAIIGYGFLGIMMTGMALGLWPVYWLMLATRRDSDQPKADRELYRICMMTLRRVGEVLIAAAVFFALNAYTPTTMG